MISQLTKGALRSKFRSVAVYFQVAVLAAASVTPVVVSGDANAAAQLSSRSVAISTSSPQATADYNFKFSWADNINVQGVILQFCKTPLGTCTLPGSSGGAEDNYVDDSKRMDLSGASLASDSGFPNDLTTSVSANTGACNDVTGVARTMICLTPTGGTATGSATDATLSLSGIVNPGTPDKAPNVSNSTTVYVRISLYSTAGFAGTGEPVYMGTVATSINQQLTVSGRVQERLNFCIAAITGGDTNLPQTVNSCAAVADSVIDLGIIDNTSIVRSPIPNNPPSQQGNNKYGIAMVNTNAGQGVSITYFAEPDATGTEQLRAFRVPGAECNATKTNLLDQCFYSVSTKNAFTVGNENFGMNIPCIIAYDGTTPINSVSTTTKNLGAATDYSSSDGDTDPVANCETSDPGNSFAWNDTSSAVEIADSPTVVDNEIVKLNFGATASATTPTGAYTVVSTYIATPKF